MFSLNKSHIPRLLLLGLIFISSACSTHHSEQPDIKPPTLSYGEYEELIDKNTHTDKKYNGLYNKYHVWATFLTTEVQTAQLDLIRFYLQQPEKEYDQAVEKAQQERSNSTKVFLSYFSPEKDYTKLHRPTSLWRFYLEFEGKRYEGKVTQEKEKELQLKKIYPHHTRWSVPYMVTFNLPMSTLETGKATFIMTSSAGKSIFELNPRQ